MAGTFTIEPGPPDFAPPATPVLVYKYTPPVEGDDSGKSPYSLLPNVYCASIAEMQGDEPTSAQFVYLTDDTYGAVFGWPSQFEDLWPMQAAASPYRVAQGDRVVVVAVLPDGTLRLLFDGFATAPQADVSADEQRVTFSAASAEVRCWDSPIAGRWQRHGDKPTSTSDDDVIKIGSPTRFNPDGKPNCTPDDKDVDSDPYADFPHPVFIQNQGDDAGDGQSFWTLANAAKYLMARYNVDQEYVDNPDFTVLDALLNNRAPKDGTDTYDPNDPATYDENPITLSDYDGGNRPWPDVLGELLGYYGFGMRFISEFDEKGLPWHHLEIERRDQVGPRDPKNLQLPKVGANVDPAKVNVGAFHIANDFRDVANRIEIETGPRLYEAAFVLAPGFTPDAADATAENAVKYLLTAASAATDTVRDKYRLYVFDELAEGHWSFEDSAWVDTGDPPSLDDVFPQPDVTYVHRLRPGLGDLVTKDDGGEPIKAQLHFSRDYAGPDPPCVWDGTGTWQAITGSWRQLDDRLGIFITAEDLRAWKIGKDSKTSPQEDSLKLDAIRSIADPSATEKSTKRFFLRLTTTIEGDHGIDAVADRRDASPLKFTIARRVDARDHYRHAEVAPSSPFYDPNDGEDDDKPDVLIDDTDKALEKATQLRAAHEFPPISGSVTIPRLDFSLQIGDRIATINGRDVSLRVNAGAEAGEAPSYPFVVARTLEMAGDRQVTILQLSDRRNEGQGIGRRR